MLNNLSAAVPQSELDEFRARFEFDPMRVCCYEGEDESPAVFGKFKSPLIANYLMTIADDGQEAADQYVQGWIVYFNAIDGGM